MYFVRYLDVSLVLMTAPFVLLADMPALGYLLGACAWLLTRFAVALLHERAASSGDPRAKAGLHVAGMLGRVWIVALFVIAARYLGDKADGVMAASLVLGAFTVYLLMTVIENGGRPGSRSTSGSPSSS
ncbi:MAG TPA: hypothetical protein VLJ42_10780 [Solirubrobacteraceae bacterium]|nr:hypothetical protein [Solirubrobacteraceae bacterium]